ncbi:MAG: AAA domain-containing protein [Vicinamibacterales bacterium]
MTLERSDGAREERLRVGTVDAFQGKEFDVVILSATRSNLLPAISEEDRREKYGHLMLANRLCVAMAHALADIILFYLLQEHLVSAPEIDRILQTRASMLMMP